jgi:hypothetical protein
MNQLAQDGVHWWAIVNVVLKLAIFFTSRGNMFEERFFVLELSGLGSK